jgi:hypothetical protein
MNIWKKLVGFGRACAPVRCAHPSFWAHCHPKRGAARPPPSIAASLLLIRPPNIYKIYKVLTYEEYRAVSGVFQNIDPPTPLHPANMSLPRTKGGGVHHTRREVREWEVNILEDARHWIGLLQYNLSAIQSIELGPPTSRAFFFPLDHRGCEIWGPLPPAPPPPIAASLILPAIFWGQPVRPYALNFFVFSFFYIVFWYFLFVILFLFSLLFISFHSYLLILLFLSLLILLILHVLFFVFLFFFSYIWICLLYYRHAGGQAFFDSFGAKVYTCATILFFCSYLFLFLSSSHTWQSYIHERQN